MTTTELDITPRVLEEHCEWTIDTVGSPEHWTEILTDDELAEIDAALRHAEQGPDDLLQIGAEHFPLPTLHDRLTGIADELINGRGFVRLRGLQRDRYSQAQMELIYWGLGMHIGSPWPQNKHGHVLGDVIDQGKAFDDPEARGNELGGTALPFHCDGSDIVGLMCLSNGLEGGLSTVANTVTIHNTLVRESPELAAALYEPYPYDFRGEQAEGGRPFYELPVFTEWEGRLFVRCIPPYIYASQRHAEAPRLSERARAALDRVVELAENPANHVAMELLPGDIQLIDNFHVMHGRTSYVDDRSSGAVRHLKRLWLETPVLSSRPSHFVNRFDHWSQRASVSRITVD